MNKGLIALAIGGFGIGMTEFVIMGILPDVATALDISIPQAGHFISAYALGVVVGAPLLTGIGGKWPAHKTLLFLMLWFTVFNSLSAFADSYTLLLISRFLSGLPSLGLVPLWPANWRNRAKRPEPLLPCLQDLLWQM